LGENAITVTEIFSPEKSKQKQNRTSPAGKEHPQTKRIASAMTRRGACLCLLALGATFIQSGEVSLLQ
jgi:hypothetical protein